MADTKITALTAITTVDPAVDVFPIVDVSDTTMAASGTTKKITSNQLLGAGGTATLASATITGDLTVATSSLKVTGGNTGFGTTSPLGKIDVRGTAYFNGTGASGGASQLIAAFGASGGSNFGQIINTGSTWSLGYGASYSSVGTSAVTWDSSGNLGLGVTPQAWDGNFKAMELGYPNFIAGNAGAYRIDVGVNGYFSGAGYKYAATGVAASYYSQSSGAHRWYNAPSGTAGNAITFTQAMTLDASGNLLVGVTSANASGGVLQLKSGITFPATQVASSDANTLDDYEEGTWTPTDASGAGLTFTVSNCRYTKVGRLVTVQGSITYPATANGSNATWGGFPFNSSDSFNLGIVYTDVAVSSLTYISSNGVNAFLLTPGVNVINSTVSGKTIAFYGTYMI